METFQGNEYFRNRICNYGRRKMSKKVYLINRSIRTQRVIKNLKLN
jgi:hypothetical protein